MIENLGGLTAFDELQENELLAIDGGRNGNAVTTMLGAVVMTAGGMLIGSGVGFVPGMGVTLVGMYLVG
jgi:hypothetical protein